jgi:hypothetical protein
MMQANDENVPIQLWLAGRSYRIRVRAADAERIQRSIKLADEKITELKLNYAGKDDQDFIAMCLIIPLILLPTLKSFLKILTICWLSGAQ